MIDESRRYTGRIIHVNVDKGYGFITCPDEIRFTRIFFYWQGLRPSVKFESLKKGMTVEFNAREYEGQGVRAIKVEVVNGTEDSGSSNKGEQELPK